MLIVAWFCLWVLMNSPYAIDEGVKRILFLVILVILIVLSLAGPGVSLFGYRL